MEGSFLKYKLKLYIQPHKYCKQSYRAKSMFHSLLLQIGQ